MNLRFVDRADESAGLRQQVFGDMAHVDPDDEDDTVGLLALLDLEPRSCQAPVLSLSEAWSVPGESGMPGTGVSALSLVPSHVFAFFIVDVNARRVVHVAVARASTRQWTAQQPRNATPFGQGPRLLVRNSDAKLRPVFDRVARVYGSNSSPVCARPSTR